jgi:hypothetical protein
MVYWDVEYAPGQPYRMAMMGNDTYFFVPATGVIGHSDDTVEEVRARYGEETVIWRGQWTTPDDLAACERLAMACDTLDKLTDEWLANPAHRVAP